MIVNGINRNPKGMSKEEKIGLAFGAVAFIVVLLFFLVLGNMSYVPEESAAPAGASGVSRPSVAPAAPPVAVIQPESSALGFGDMFMMVGGVALLIGFWVMANRFGWLSIETVSSASEASAEIVAPLKQERDTTALPPFAEIYEEIKSLTLDLARKEQEVEKLTLDLASACSSLATLKKQLGAQTAKASELSRDLSRRHQTIQRLSEERRQMGDQLQALYILLGVQKGDSLTEKVEEREQELAAALSRQKELSRQVTLLSEQSLFKEAKAEELSEFWLTVKLDGKPFMSKRRQLRLLSRMKAENMAIVRK